MLRPDIVIGLADYEYNKRPGVKRLESMGDRTLAWTQDMLAGINDDKGGSPDIAFFAPLLPIEAGQQSYYLDMLKNELARVSGWTIFDPASLDALPEDMRHLPRFALTEIRGPHDILDHIALGLDIVIPSFIGDATDAGLALTFIFPSPQKPQGGNRLPLGVDMWSEKHLLDAKEMLAWVLLQIHNHHVMDVFFAGVRQRMSDGQYETDRDMFHQTYERELPASTGQGPRLRGYQVKSGPAQLRRNAQAYRPLGDGSERLAENPLPSPGANGEQLQELGFPKKLP
ncbi:MAG: hypothetical protein Q9207_000490 [Kuettlingeria erythrocarpa]